MIAATGLVLAAGVLFAVDRLRASRGTTPRLSTMSFYTIDDGATLFVDDKNNLPPFDHNGHQAVMAFVFTADQGEHQWVQYLQKYSPQAKAQAEKLRTSHDSSGINFQLLREGLYVKRPGAGSWVEVTDPKAIAIMNPVAPPSMGTSIPQAVWP